MNPFRSLRLSVIGFFVLLTALIPIAIGDDESLPDVVREFSRSQPAPLWALAVGVVTLVGVIVGSIAMLVQKKWGAWLHLVSNGAGILVALFFGVQVMSAATTMINSLLLITSGFIYGLAFFTDALSRGPIQRDS